MELNNSIEHDPPALSGTCANLAVFRTAIPSGTKSLLTEFFKDFLNAGRIVVADSGHLMYLEKPQEFTGIVIGFLAVVGFFVSLRSPVARLQCRKGKSDEEVLFRSSTYVHYWLSCRSGGYNS